VLVCGEWSLNAFLILADIEVLRKRGYSAEIIIQKTGLSPKYLAERINTLGSVSNLNHPESEGATL